MAHIKAAMCFYCLQVWSFSRLVSRCHFSFQTLREKTCFYVHSRCQKPTAVIGYTFLLYSTAATVSQVFFICCFPALILLSPSYKFKDLSDPIGSTHLVWLTFLHLKAKYIVSLIPPVILVLLWVMIEHIGMFKLIFCWRMDKIQRSCLY